MEETITVTEASRNFSDLVNRVAYRSKTAVLTRGGKPVARMSPIRAEETTGLDVARKVRSRVRMPKDEADAYAADLKDARSVGNKPQRDPWAG
jgi:prevent-host-death family protein